MTSAPFTSQTPEGDEIDWVNHPPHYKSHPSGVEVIRYTRLLPFGPGNAVKYVMRRGSKGNPVQDIEKAIWYLHDSIEHGVWYHVTTEMKRVLHEVLPYEEDMTVFAFLTVMLDAKNDSPGNLRKDAAAFSLALDLLDRLKAAHS